MGFSLMHITLDSCRCDIHIYIHARAHVRAFIQIGCSNNFAHGAKGHGRSQHNERHNIRSISFIVHRGTLLEGFPMFSKTVHLVQ